MALQVDSSPAITAAEQSSSFVQVPTVLKSPAMSKFVRVYTDRSSYCSLHNRVIVVLLIAAIYTGTRIDSGPSYKPRDRFWRISGWAKVQCFRHDPDCRAYTVRIPYGHGTDRAYTAYPYEQPAKAHRRAQVDFEGSASIGRTRRTDSSAAI